MNKIVLVVLLITLSIFCVECGKTYRGGSRSRPTQKSRSRPTAKPPTNSYGSGGGYYGNTYNSQRKATDVRTTPKYTIRTQPTPRYPPQPTSRYYPQQVTPKVVYPQQVTPKVVYPQQVTPKVVYPQQSSGYHTPRPHYQQPVYPKQPYPQQNYPTYQQPNYKPTYTGNNYYSPGGYYNPGGHYKKDHSTRNAVLAGLGGSALGMYLGYQLGGYTHSLSNPNVGNVGYGGGGGAGGYPQYSVVHHYHHGDKPIIQNAVVEPNVITQCNDVHICTPNTTPLCMTNGTIYCVTPIGQTNICNVNSTNLQCVNATITAPCLNATDGSCNSNVTMTQNLEIPCVSNIDVYGNLGTNGMMVQNTLANQEISNKYCVTVIAEPFVEPRDLTNEEYARYLQQNDMAKQQADAKMGDIFNSIGSFMFF